MISQMLSKYEFSSFHPFPGLPTLLQVPGWAGEALTSRIRKREPGLASKVGGNQERPEVASNEASKGHCWPRQHIVFSCAFQEKMGIATSNSDFSQVLRNLWLPSRKSVKLPGESAPNGRKWSHTSNVSVLGQSVLEDIETVSFCSGPCQDVKGMGQLENPSVVPTPLPSGESVALDWAQAEGSRSLVHPSGFHILITEAGEKWHLCYQEPLPWAV